MRTHYGIGAGSGTLDPGADRGGGAVASVAANPDRAGGDVGPQVDPAVGVGLAAQDPTDIVVAT